MNDKLCASCQKTLTGNEVFGVFCNECLTPRAIKVEADQGQVGGTHYKDMAVQPWHVMESVLSREEFIGYLKGNVIKYGMRQGRKGEDDAGKCRHYQQKLKEVLNQFTNLYSE